MTDDRVMCVASCILGNSLWPPRDVACQPEDEALVAFLRGAGVGAGICRPQKTGVVSSGLCLFQVS